jgi:hypothetical protein
MEENGSAVLWKKGKSNEAIDYLLSLNYKIVDKWKNDYIMESNALRG